MEMWFLHFRVFQCVSNCSLEPHTIVVRAHVCLLPAGMTTVSCCESRPVSLVLQCLQFKRHILLGDSDL